MKDLDLTSYSKEDLKALRTKINVILTKMNEEENLKNLKQLNARQLTILLFFILHGYYKVEDALLLHNREDMNTLRPYLEKTRMLVNNVIEFEYQKDRGELTDVASYLMEGIADLRKKIKLIKGIVKSVYVLDVDFIEKNREILKSLLSENQKKNLNKIMKDLIKEMVFVKGTMSFYGVHSNYLPIQMAHICNIFGLSIKPSEVV